MTQEEIRKEMQECGARIRQLSNEVERENGFSVVKPKIDEMIRLADRMAELDSMNRKLLLAMIKEAHDKALSTIRNKAKGLSK